MGYDRTGRFEAFTVNRSPGGLVVRGIRLTLAVLSFAPYLVRCVTYTLLHVKYLVLLYLWLRSVGMMSAQHGEFHAFLRFLCPFFLCLWGVP